MTAEDRISALTEFGFTVRHARFLVTVMRHAGVCLLRQYARFAGLVHGQKTRALFAKLVRRGYASAYACRHNRGRLYHVHHYALYQAIGEPHSRYRRPVPAGRVIERLMVLDAVLASPELTWLATQAEKVAHFTALTPPVPIETLPHATRKGAASPPAGAFPDKFPIGVDPDGRTVVVYLVMTSGLDQFRAFLGRHAELCRAVPAWTLRLVFPRSLEHAYQAYHAVIREEWESPLHRRTIDQLTAYFEQRRASAKGSVRPADERCERAAWTFDGLRFEWFYRRWLKGGNTALDEACSPVISEALASGAGRIECLVLPHHYSHLSPLVDIVGARPTEAEKRAEKGEHEGEQTSPRPRPPFTPASFDTSGSASA